MQILGAFLIMLSAVLLVTFSSSTQSGWRNLSQNYRFRENNGPKQWRFVTARMAKEGRLSGFRAALNIGADKLGLYLSVFALFRLWHPPLFVPWSDLTIHCESNEIEFHFSGSPDVVLQLKRDLGQEILVHRPKGNPAVLQSK
jgi:hypothetical protein